MVLFLRPTESPIVFLQQLGRGLRKSKGKEYLNVLDFIGNYEKAGRTRFLLTGKNLSEKNNYYSLNQSDFPDDCLIDFDIKIIDLFAEMDKKNLKISEQIQKEYFRVKELLGRTPSRMELFIYMEDDIYELAITHAKENPFKRYLSYQRSLKELTANEEVFYQNENGREFINPLECQKFIRCLYLGHFIMKEMCVRKFQKNSFWQAGRHFFLQERIGKTLTKNLPMKNILQFQIKTI